MDLKIDEIMELSLDDYIAMSMNSSSSNGVKNSGSSHDVECNTSGSSTDVKFGRRKGNIDDDEEEEDDFKNQVPKKVNDDSDIGIWKGPDSSISYLGFNRRQNDLREKLNNGMNVHKEKITPIQCRLKAPNNFANRPRGLPTLLPLESYTNKNSNNNNNRNGSKYSGGGRGGFNNLQRNLDFGFRKNFRQNNNGIGMSGISNGRVQRNRRQDIDSKNLRFSVTRDNTNINPTSPSQSKI
ncbi:hypothetical protein DOY81_010979 [Sarcophaga bullata]|nr:hypothetical protein DOY81_010979 [Sarcophaga bullata]